MSFELNYELTAGSRLTISAQNLKDLVGLYTSLGGDSAFLQQQVKSIVAANEMGFAVVNTIRELGGVIENGELVRNDPGQDPGDAAQAADTGPADPWAGDSGDEDLWGTPAQSRAPKGSPARTHRRADPSPSSPHPNITTSTDRFDRQWTLGLPEAPDCHCGDPAARVKGKSQAGKPYTAYKCAKGAPDGNWQDKCDFSEFPN